MSNFDVSGQQEMDISPKKQYEDYGPHILSRSNCLKLKQHNDGSVSYNEQLFALKEDRMWCGLLWCFYHCLDSHSDGTHSLQRIHWGVNDVMLHSSKSVPMKKQTHLHFRWPGGEYIFFSGWIIPLEELSPGTSRHGEHYRPYTQELALTKSVHH